MAKKKSEPAPAGSNRQKNIFVLRGSEEWKAWLDGLAEHLGLPVSIAVEQALREKADRSGYVKAPKRY